MMPCAVPQPSENICASSSHKSLRTEEAIQHSPAGTALESIVDEHRRQVSRLFQELVSQYEEIHKNATVSLLQRLDLCISPLVLQSDYQSMPVWSTDNQISATASPQLQADCLEGPFNCETVNECSGQSGQVLRAQTAFIPKSMKSTKSSLLRLAEAPANQNGPSRQRHSVIVSEAAARRARESMTSLAKFVHGSAFEAIVTAAILSNGAFLGFQVEAENENAALYIVHLAFCVIFTLELLLRVTCDGQNFFLHDRFWNAFDVFSVISSLIELAFRSSSGTPQTNMMVWRILRIFRLVRLARLVRLKMLRELRLMIHSLIHCLKPLGWTVSMLLVVTYVFAIIFTESAKEASQSGQVPASTQMLLKEYYGSIYSSMFTLLSSVLGGKDWRDYTQPLRAVHWSLEFLFSCFIVFIQLALLNVVTGIFVDSSMNAAMSDKQSLIQDEMMRQGMHRTELDRLFAEVDTENQGRVSVVQLQEFLSDERVQTYLKVLDVVYWDPRDIIVLLRRDPEGYVSCKEFTSACLKLKSVRLLDITGMMQETKGMLKTIASQLTGVHRSILSSKISTEQVNPASITHVEEKPDLRVVGATPMVLDLVRSCSRQDRTS